MAYDLIGLGLRLRDLGTERLSWGDLRVIVQQSPPGSALFRAMNPDDWQWTFEAQLIAEAADQLRVANWQRSGGKKRDYPKPIPRPGVEPDSKTFGGKGALPYDEMADWLGWSAA